MTTEHHTPTPLDVLGASAPLSPPPRLSFIVPHAPLPLGVADDRSTALADELARAYEELQAADDELRAQRAELDRLIGQRRSLTSALPLPVVTTDRVGKILAANPAAARRFNVAPLVLTRKPMLAFVHPADRRSVRSLLDSVGDEPARIDLRLVPRAHEPSAAQVVVAAQGDQEVLWTVLDAPDDVRAAEGTTLALGLAELCRLPVATTDAWRLLGSIATIVRDALETVDAASAVLGAPEEPSAVGSSDDLAAAMDGLQMRVAEGPTIEAYATGRLVVADDLTRDARWPALARVAAGAGARAAVALPLRADGELVGTVTCYAAAAGAFGPAQRARSELVASATGAVLAAAFQQARLRDLAENLDRALVSRQEIDEAKGIVMEQRRCGPDEAFQYLAALSQRENVKVRVLAHLIVSQAAGIAP
jgi:PAS domain-containing protein